ncbi:MAG: apolipoprotein N-acyltransferase [Propionibacteriaceae bacterium]|jgi:apolipoprotein N-acyltransferase|nr:apolipoprotein N-acyltransferase [Propionibacteriaceae bacterium]
MSTAVPVTPSTPSRGPSRLSRRSRRLVTGLAAVAAGVCTGLAFPPTGWWPLLPLGLAVFGWLTAIRRPRGRMGLALGFLFGLGFFAVLIRWLLVVEVWFAYFALTAVMALWLALLGGALTWLGRFRGWPAFAASAWIVVEFADSRWPLGGFPWGRLAYAAAGTPIDGWFPVISASGVSWLIAATSFLLPWAAAALVQERRAGRLSLRQLFADDPAPAPAPPGVGGVAPVPLPEIIQDAVKPLRLLSLAARPVAAWVLLTLTAMGGWMGDQYQPAATDQTVTVGIIQGNVPGTGLDAIGPARTTTRNSLAETIALMARVETGELPRPDFILWPETSVDMDAEADAETGRLVAAASDVAQAPILVGGLTRLPEEGHRYTVAAWWSEDNVVTSRYYKKNIVPFGEYVPGRAFWQKLFPVLELVGLQTIPGSGPGVVLGALDDGRTIPVGVLICFEVGYDATADQMILGDATLPGAQLVTVQTNNSALTGTGQMEQQDAITRIRAMEARRDILVATTNSLADWIGPDGVHRWTAEPEHSAATSVTVPLRTNVTFAVAHRRAIEVTLVAVPALFLGLGLLRRRARMAP